LYSPVLGPPIRRAIGQWNLDLILDGEVLAWDSDRQENVPFGYNRNVAQLRTAYMEQKHLLDPKDQNLHVNDTCFKSMNSTNAWKDHHNSAPNELAGKECWLQYIIFDVIYVDGPNVIPFLKDTVSSYVSISSGGSIIHLDGFERKKVLHKLISIQCDEVEIVKTWVVRPNGRITTGEDYFHPSQPSMECDYPEYTLDSLNCNIVNINNIDMARRNDLSDEQISQTWANVLQIIYQSIVENQQMETTPGVQDIGISLSQIILMDLWRVISMSL
jgi:ATP dependent DNA ligase domain